MSNLSATNFPTTTTVLGEPPIIYLLIDTLAKWTGNNESLTLHLDGEVAMLSVCFWVSNSPIPHHP